MGKFKVLLVDDDPDLRDVTAEMIRSIDADVTEASNGHAALDYILRRQPEVVIVDLNMPIMGGMKLVQSLLRQGFPASRIMVYSATLDRSRLIQLAHMQVRHFFVKPVDPVPFLARIRQVAAATNPAIPEV